MRFVLLFFLVGCIDLTEPVKEINVNKGVVSGPNFELYRNGYETKVVVWLHDGGWRFGSHILYDTSYQLKLLNDSTAVASVNYRLSGQAKFPAQLNDVEFAINQLKLMGYQNIGLWGYSAGGHLAALAGTHCNCGIKAVATWAAPIDFLSEDRQLIKAGYSARVNFPNSAETQLLGFIPNTDSAATKQSSPITFIDSSDPPFIIFHGLYDPKVPVAQAGMLAANLNLAGITNQRLQYKTNHGSVILKSDSSMNRLRTFFKTHLR